MEGGAIPVSAIRQCAREELLMDPDLVFIFTTTIREMDVIYLEWLGKEREKAMKKSAPPAKPAGGKKTRAKG